MKILYNDERCLRQEVDWLLCSGGIISVDILEDLAKFQGYQGNDENLSEFTYNEEDILEIEQDGIFSLNRKERSV